MLPFRTRITGCPCCCKSKGRQKKRNRRCRNSRRRNARRTRTRPWFKRFAAPTNHPRRSPTCYGVRMNPIWCIPLLASCAAAQTPLVNPLLPAGPDPWITSRNGFYYYMNTTGSSLVIWKTKNIAALSTAEKKTVWEAPASGPYSHDIWAPELHFLRGKWYIYFAADAGRNESHRIWVLENDSEDPLAGGWQMKGKVTDQSD